MFRPATTRRDPGQPAASFLNIWHIAGDDALRESFHNCRVLPTPGSQSVRGLFFRAGGPDLPLTRPNLFVAPITGSSFDFSQRAPSGRARIFQECVVASGFCESLSVCAGFPVKACKIASVADGRYVFFRRLSGPLGRGLFPPDRKKNMLR